MFGEASGKVKDQIAQLEAELAEKDGKAQSELQEMMSQSEE